MDVDSYPNFETLCRLCLRAETATVKIFPNDAANYGQLSIPVRIMACAALEVLSGDELPKAICVECRYQLEKSYYFRKRCQLSDSKLKKHIRLLNLGKKSRIFSRTTEEDFEDELEFEDSLNFLKEKDTEREKEEAVKNERWREEMKEVWKTELHEEVEDKVRQKLQESVREEVCRSLKNSLRSEVRAELRDEVAAEVRQSLRLEVRQECIDEAKIELRDELQEKCREEECKSLLDELNNFLKLKRNKMQKSQVTMERRMREETPDDEETELAAHSNVGVDENIEKSSIKKSEKRPSDSLLLNKAQKIKYDDAQTGVGNSDNEISSTEQALSFVAVPTSVHEDGVDGTESNFYIIEGDDESGDLEEDGQNVNTYFSFEDAVNFQITPSESSDNGGTSYQIEENGKLKCFKKENEAETDENDEAEVENADDIEDENVLIFDPENEQDENSEQVMEQDDYEKQTLSIDKISNKTNAESAIKRTISSVPILINSQSGTSAVIRTSDVTKTFQCSECPRVFTTQASTLRHLAMHRLLEKRGVSYKCPNCRIILSCKSALNRHMLKHSGRRPYICEDCGKSFIQREILKRHLLTHSGVRPYDCPHCDRSFSQKLNLTQHVNSCHTENPKVQQYACHMCPKRFNHASGLSRHLATHSGVAFQCTECDRTFTDRSSVKRHIVHVHGIGTIEKTVHPKNNTEANRLEQIDEKKDDENSAEFII